MSRRELGRVEVLARVRSRELRVVDAARLLGVSYRQAKRLWKRYQAEGAAGLKHRSAGRRSNRAYAARFRRKVLGRVREKYGGPVGERFGPTLAVWAEMNLVLADEFRDGNVPAQMEPRRVAQRSFAARPSTVREYYYRGDSACHESGLVNWLRAEQRPGGPPGRIGFALRARMSEALHKAIQAVPEPEWESYGDPHPEEIRECAEVPFVPGEKSEKKDTQPLRYVAIRIRKQQGELFEDGSRERHFAVLTNRWELKAARLIEWHREKAGTVEMVHDVVKNELGGGVLPSKYFGANAAWRRLAVISPNVLTALKRLALPPELLTARPKRLRFLIFNTPGRLVHHARRLLLRRAAGAEWIAAYREGRRLLPLPS